VSWLEPNDGEEPRLLPELDDEFARPRRRQAAVGSAALHLALVAAMGAWHQVAPPVRRAPAPKPEREVTLLFSPPKELTQKESNRGPLSKLFLGPTERPRPPLLIVPRGQPAPAPPLPKTELPLDDKPPQLTVNPEAGAAVQLAQAPPPAQPKLALEDAHRPSGARSGQAPELAPQRAGAVVEGAVRDVSRNPGSGGTTVGDASGGLPGGFTVPAPANVGSNLELLSDPKGVDFRPYLTRILSMVRRNWYAVIPESARLGMVRGRVAIQFIVVRQGAVSKLVIAGPSGQEALDRAAVAGISASHPFPPLPPEYRGDHIRLQFTFLYNIPVK